ncbi:hypothetical protein MHLP_01985 [Candidatus Mycoplasma haematolamae str. Purdue]|uniref:Uncharacterized protein n=1 Tax=Mycoplasma haematolamae (strain Purdue) TaxID=1212765 RepID=I7C666_MYCHA|nr:hypothetical protein [Candidatus Mycoplasma haematolamae]AFO51977.1 hypothetical protein MHLP_01985 [Candidatus Mycoplasma haematolamae str. Purdue]
MSSNTAQANQGTLSAKEMPKEEYRYSGYLYLMKAEDDSSYVEQYVYKLTTDLRAGIGEKPVFIAEFSTPIAEEKVKTLLDEFNGWASIHPSDMNSLVDALNSTKKGLNEYFGPEILAGLERSINKLAGKN